ncbi:hypothetical protein TGDOM2_248360 [Toxoplasma gondii GAB2-2007-GAL-DOM2]|uniref:Uncharacterized protein n=5 Tax=Toxoplasma gondii TaxID=5811 RepID=S7V0Z3_TOXGG|nr:hypothetical protein TGGT1_248360 [Toxoplasma gondii GT1]KAF4638615.1 hypothetical protein TGRH88_062230 [Toxoplasma gondii]KFG46562.1 hypothetical protein TGDOM2_248360 [Toxoplasma gondii GAB2-2007-GAL-DOM2]KFG54093.1 hypothetical protein TGFOU_248360 [Toxoplasma gondii FOU]RQX72118.1 hypothetical protein TGCAST_248360 [Toxoplasma gondii CAST]
MDVQRAFSSDAISDHFEGSEEMMAQQEASAETMLDVRSNEIEGYEVPINDCQYDISMDQVRTDEQTTAEDSALGLTTKAALEVTHRPSTTEDESLEKNEEHDDSYAVTPAPPTLAELLEAGMQAFDFAKFFSSRKSPAFPPNLQPVQLPDGGLVEIFRLPSFNVGVSQNMPVTQFNAPILDTGLSPVLQYRGLPPCISSRKNIVFHHVGGSNEEVWGASQVQPTVKKSGWPVPSWEPNARLIKTGMA